MIILSDYSYGAIFTFDHDHLAFFENVISRYLSVTFLSSLPQNVMEFRLGIKKVIGD